MKKLSVLKMFLMLCPTMGTYGMDSNGAQSTHDDSKKNSKTLVEKRDAEEAKTTAFLQAQQEDVKWGLIIGTAGGIGNVLIAYTQDPTIKGHMNDFSEQARNAVLRNMIAPAYKKAYTIKDHGITLKDIGIGFILLAGLYGIKKIHDSFGLWHAIRTGDWSQPQKKFENIKYFVKKNALSLSLLTASIVSAIVFWRRYKHTVSELSYDKFVNSFTSEQRQELHKSSEWHKVIHQGKHDPTILQSSEKIMNTLTEEQQDLLGKVIDDYLLENPHVGFEE